MTFGGRYLKLLAFDLGLFFIFYLISDFIPLTFILLLFISFFCFYFSKKLLSFILNNLIYGKKNANLTEFEQKTYKFLFENKYFYEIFIENQLKILIESKKLDDSIIKNELSIFIKTFSKIFIQSWYLPHISDNQEFISESEKQLEVICYDLFKRVSQINKLTFFKYFAHIADKNFINFTERNLSSAEIDVTMLHSALQNLPKSEIDHIKRYVELVLSKSAPASLHINELFIQEFFMQIIGKNCFKKLIDLISQPNFIYYAIILLCDQKFEFDIDNDNIVKNENEKDESNMECDPTNLDDKLSINSSVSMFSDDASSILQTYPDSDSERSYSITSQVDVDVKQSETKSISIDSTSLIDIIDIKIIETETDYEVKSGDQFTVYIVQVCILKILCFIVFYILFLSLRSNI